jgi:hypothetical protein
MAQGSKTEPKLEARPAAQGWCVYVSWPSGDVENVTGFQNQYQAITWIKEKSANWIADKIMRDRDTL